MASNVELLFQKLPFSVLVISNDGRILFINEPATHLTGFTNADLFQQKLSEILSRVGDEDEIDQALTDAREKGLHTIEAWICVKDGSRIWSEVIFTACNYTELEGAAYICAIQNIDAKKNIELEFRRTEERFKLMVESVQEYSIYMMDSRGTILTWNDGARAIKGYLASEIIGKNFSAFYTPEDRQINKPERALRIALETGKYHEEGWRLKKNGSAFWASIVLTPLYDTSGNHLGFSKVTRDITEKKQNEEILRQSEERFRLLVEQVKDYGIFMMDKDGVIISWNEGAANIKGYTAEEIIGKHFSTFYSKEDLIQGKPEMELKVARKVGRYEEEGWRIRKDGSVFWANIIITAVYNKDVLVGFSKVTRDLTEKKKAEQALADSRENFRKIANELTETNKILSTVNLELEQFTSIVSHDLQEPVRTLKSFLLLIKKDIDHLNSDNLKTYIDKSIAAANRMRELIQNLLYYSQVSRSEVIREPLIVEELFSIVKQNLKASIDEKNAVLHFNIHQNEIYGNKILLIQLLQNLISNALKFNVSAQPEIRISSFVKDGLAQFSVQDNGIGIAAEDRKKVFDIFRRLVTNKSFPGMGIGLAICKKIVEQHHGNIWIESKSEKGTTFFVALNKDLKAVEL